MAVTVLKADHARQATTLQGSQQFFAMMNFQGVEYARNGESTAALPFVVDFDLSIPNANVVYPVPGGAGATAQVWAFPLHAVPESNFKGPNESWWPSFRKPRFPRSRL